MALPWYVSKFRQFCERRNLKINVEKNKMVRRSTSGRLVEENEEGVKYLRSTVLASGETKMKVSLKLINE